MDFFLHTLFPAAALVLLALVHLLFAYVEMFRWEKFATRKLGQTPAEARASAVLAKNQGLYNAFLAAGALWALAEWLISGPEAGRGPALFFGGCAIAAGLYGWWTVGRRPAFLTHQALPGALAAAGGLAGFLTG
jgi:putative membrane protein